MMPLDTLQANGKTEAINAAFAEIGVAGATIMPRRRGLKNTEPVAWEYHVSSHLDRIATARKKKAHAAAVKVGVIFDHLKDPRAVGTNALVYAGDLVEISVAVATPVSRLDDVALLAELVAKHGVKQSIIDRLVAKYTTDNRAAHKFTSSLVAA